MQPFTIVSDFRPTGDQPQAIARLTDGLAQGRRDQVLLGVTGSGKTFTIAQVAAAARVAEATRSVEPAPRNLRPLPFEVVLPEMTP